MKRGEFVKGIRAVAFFITVAALVIAAASNPVVAFDGTMVLGRPTDCCITINVISNEPLDAYFEYDTQSGIYGNRTATITIECVIADPAQMSSPRGRNTPSIPKERRAAHSPSASRAIRIPREIRKPLMRNSTT